MATWTTPRTWTTGELVTAAIGNAHWRDNLLYLYESGPVTIDRDVTQADINNTVTETTVYSYTVPANILSTTRGLRISMQGHYFNNGAGSPTPDVNFRLKFGGTTIAGETAFSTVPASALLRRVLMRAWIHNGNSASVQRCYVETTLGGLGSDDTSSMSAAFVRQIGGHASLAIDTTIAQALLITVQHSVADANIKFRANAVLVELI